MNLADFSLSIEDFGRSIIAKTDFLEQISNANLRFFIHPNFAFLSGPNKVDLRGISKLIEVK